MSGLFNAHIIGRRKRGDREEVRLKLFNPDGSPFSGRGDTLLIGAGNPNAMGFSGQMVAHDDFTEFHLSDPTWWERSIPDPELDHNPGKVSGLAWGGLLLPGGPQIAMRTTVQITSIVGVEDQVGALVRGAWDGPTDDGNNFSYVGAWLMDESAGSYKLVIAGHGPSGYRTEEGFQVSPLTASRSYWLRCTIDEQSVVTAEVFSEPPSLDSIPNLSFSVDWSDNSPNPSGYGGVNTWTDNRTSIEDILVETVEPLPSPGIPGDYWLDSEAKVLYGPRGENDFPMGFSVGVPQIFDEYFIAASENDRSLTPNTATLEDTVNVLATLIEDLRSIGIIKP